MGKFDKYLLQQLMILFGFFSLVLVLVYWINRAVILFDRLIASGQSAGVFLEITALSLPNVIRIVLPISAFVAAVFVANRLNSESELVVVQATGYSPWRLVRAVAVFGIIVGLLLAVLTHILVPASVRELDLRQAEITRNITARLLTEGTFVHPVDGITFYVREITPEGELRDIFLSDSRSETQRTTYSARRALLIADEGGPKLIMVNGMAQTLSLKDQRLAVTSFSDFSFDIGALLPEGIVTSRRASALPTHSLLFPTPAILAEAEATRAELIAAGHERISQSLFTAVGAVIGFGALLLGGFSRFGLWRQIAFAIVVVMVLKSLDNAMIDTARRSVDAWPLIYAAPAAGLLSALAILSLSGHPLRRHRKSSGAAA